jgi:hypothetical protein
MSGNAARRKAWEAMRAMRTFTTAALQLEVDIGDRNVRSFCKALLDAGYVSLKRQRVNGRPGSLNIYRIARDAGPRCPAIGEDGKVRDAPTSAARRKAWQSMRILRIFTLASLQSTAGIGERNARHFCNLLKATGYINLVSRATGRPGSHNTFRLVRDTGPKCPIIRDGQVFDPNNRALGV